ncbi:LysR family transcriptional regulator [Microvirga sp. 17 mud 1-3]|uniref:LysR family transcriptional regulator n=1 Tax=Microvirga sp. 17 mud 1-3 TaxID=2082949 RepID=UPI000D6B8937|nr:LysR family transcriptional regulator [Microvirga sp. 17 mud 1-3]AWM87647.1 LysR family transcriptional regulator [Microvirga sp. 17 mud 1-3]
MDDWNDLRLVLAISRSGSLTGAAKDLGVNHSTAFRRLGALEGTLGVRLFERLPGGVYAPTQAGERMAAAAERIETETTALDREIVGRDRSLSGRLRVTSSETLAFRVLTAQIARFRALHPGILVELVIDNRILSLSRREADVALRVNRPREGDLHGRKISDIAWTAYGSRALLAQAEPVDGPTGLAAFPVVGWEEGTTGINAADWLAEHVSAQAFAYRTNSIVNQLVAVKAGIGVAVLPCYLGDREPDLVRLVQEPIPELTRELWIVTHADLRRTARVRAFFDVVGEGLVAERPLLTGLSPAS